MFSVRFVSSISPFLQFLTLNFFTHFCFHLATSAVGLYSSLVNITSSWPMIRNSLCSLRAGQTQSVSAHKSIWRFSWMWTLPCLRMELTRTRTTEEFSLIIVTLFTMACIAEMGIKVDAVRFKTVGEQVIARESTLIVNSMSQKRLGVNRHWMFSWHKCLWKNSNLYHEFRE